MIELVLSEYELMQLQIALGKLMECIVEENNRLGKCDAIFFDNIITANSMRIDELVLLKKKISDASTDM